MLNFDVGVILARQVPRLDISVASRLSCQLFHWLLYLGVLLFLLLLVGVDYSLGEVLGWTHARSRRKRWHTIPINLVQSCVDPRLYVLQIQLFQRGGQLLSCLSRRLAGRLGGFNLRIRPPDLQWLLRLIQALVRFEMVFARGRLPKQVLLRGWTGRLEHRALPLLPTGRVLNELRLLLAVFDMLFGSLLAEFAKTMWALDAREHLGPCLQITECHLLFGDLLRTRLDLFLDLGQCWLHYLEV